MTPRTSALLGQARTGAALSVTLVVLLTGIAVGLETPRLLLLCLVVLAAQTSIGISLQWRGAVNRPGAPRATVPHPPPTRLVRGWALALAFASVALSVMLGPWPTLANVAFLLTAWGYTLWLRGTAFSALPYLICFGLLPFMATLSRPDPAPPAWWVVAASCLFGAGIHFAIGQQQGREDKAAQAGDLPHRVGRLASAVVVVVTLSTAIALIALSDGKLLG